MTSHDGAPCVLGCRQGTMRAVGERPVLNGEVVERWEFCACDRCRVATIRYEAPAKTADHASPGPGW